MKQSTKQRLEMMNFIICTIGDKGRETSFDFLRKLTTNQFKKEIDNEREYITFFNSQVNILVDDLKLCYRQGTLIGLTTEGIHVYESTNGIYSYFQYKEKEISERNLSFKMKVAGTISGILATTISAFTLWFSSSNLEAKTNLILIGVACFIMGFVSKDLSMLLLKSLLKHRAERPSNTE